jgi:hypothetical protein
MQLFNKLMSTIFGRGSAQSSGGGATQGTAPASTQAPASTSAPAGSTGSASGSQPMPAASAGASAAQPVDVNAVLNDMASKNSEKLDWRKSIVDLMKLVGMDSSLSARKQLADELGYSGDKNDSATMNMWLHKQVLRKLSENGGKVPQDLLD